MKYETCRYKYMDSTMKEFESGKLKLANNKRVKKRTQAIAIALSLAQRKCKYTDKELKQVEEKVMNFLKSDTRKISKDRVPLTNVIETRILIKNYIKMGKKKRANDLYKLLLKRIIKAGKDGIKITQNIYDELHKVNSYLKK
jgi:hypothetical protein